MVGGGKICSMMIEQVNKMNLSTSEQVRMFVVLELLLNIDVFDSELRSEMLGIVDVIKGTFKDAGLIMYIEKLGVGL